MHQYGGSSRVSKLILLFMFDKIEIPLTEQSAIDICVNNNWLTYMDFKQLIIELLESDFCHVKRIVNGDKLFSITQKGRDCLTSFYKSIPINIREDISEFVKNNRLEYRRKQEYFSDYVKNENGTYTVILKILDTSNDTLDLKLVVPNKAAAKAIYEKWEKKAPNIYFSLYEQLIDN